MKSRNTLPGLPLGLILATLPAFSADADPTNLNEVVVTATAVQDAKQDVPASVQVITSEDIQASPAQDVGDLLAEAGLGHITKYSGALTGSVGIRGLQSDSSSMYTSRVLILINGSKAGTVNLAKIPTQDIERIEIVKGPASVIYGTSAMGGVINIITKEGKTPGCHGDLGAEAGSADYWKGFVDAQGKEGKLDFFVSAGRESLGNYKAPRLGTIENSGEKAESLSTRLGYEIASGQHLSFGLQHWRGWDIGSQGPTYSPDPDDYNNKKRDAFDLTYRTDSFQAKYYYVADRDRWYSNADGMAGPGTDAMFKTDTDTQGVSLQKVFTFGEHRLVTGGQWDRIKVRSARVADAVPQAPYNPDSRYDSYGIFAEGRLSFLDQRLLVSAGARLDRFENNILETPYLTSMVAKKDTLNHATVRGGIVYKLTDGVNLKANLGNAYRAPSPLELASDYYSWGTHYLGNPGLNPEKSTTMDAGIDVAKGAFRFDFSYFNTDFRDAIVRIYSAAQLASIYMNAGKARLEGYELDATYDLGSALGWRLILEPFAHVNYLTNFRQESGGTWSTMTYTPKWAASSGLKVGQDAWDAQLAASYHGHEVQTDWNYNNATYGQSLNKGGFVLVNLKGSYRPLKALELSASVENLCNRFYEYNWGYPMAGRSFVGSAKWKF